MKKKINFDDENSKALHYKVFKVKHQDLKRDPNMPAGSEHNKKQGFAN